MISITVPPDLGRIAVEAPFTYKETLKALPNSRWDSTRKAWTYPPSAESAASIYKALGQVQLVVDPHFRRLLEEAKEARQNQTVKRASDEDLAEIPGRLPGWLHQKRAYHFAAPRKGTMLAMDMGTGKSRVAISLLDGWEASTAVIICPRSVVNVWPNQFAIHSERDWHVVAAPPRKSVPDRVRYMVKQLGLAKAKGMPLAFVLNYESAWRTPMDDFLLDLAGAMPVVQILDESHRVKAPGGKASQYVSRLSRVCDRRLLLTGTPMPHSPLDIYAQYRAMDPTIFGTSFTRFKARYAVMKPIVNQGKTIQVVDGYQNQEELTEKFGLGSFVVRKEDAGLDLPPVQHEERVVALEPAAKKAYAELERVFITEVGDGVVTAANALVKLLRLQQITSGFLRDDESVDREISKAKEQALVDLLEDLPTHEPKVVFAKFQHDLAVIERVCKDAGLKYGEVSGRVGPTKDTFGLNEHSQMREDLDVVALQIQSGGVGIDLTRSAYAIYYSLGYSLGDYLQSLARTDRPGQTRPVTYFHLIAEGTVDRTVYAALRSRKEVVDAVIDAAHEGSFGA